MAGIWQFGGYGQNNASNGAYQVGVGGDIPNLANGVLSFDVIYSWVKDSVSTAVLGGSTDANGNPIPPFLPEVLTATISDNTAVMLLARYTNGPLKLYAGFEQIRYSAPSDPQTAFTISPETSFAWGVKHSTTRISAIRRSVPPVLLTGFSTSIGPVPNTPSPAKWM